MDNIAGSRPALSWAVNIAVVILVLAWTIPTLGLLISSFRDRDQINTSGWWT
ncbi:MAG: alpha-glucoside transport system permease protein, partial [Halocynthiibacter sp.]